MEQTKLGSLIETMINTAIGFALSFIAWPVAALLFNMPYTHSQHWGIVLFFTIISVTRSYIVRRWFNRKLHRTAQRIAGRISPTAP